MILKKENEKFPNEQEFQAYLNYVTTDTWKPIYKYTHVPYIISEIYFHNISKKISDYPKTLFKIVVKNLTVTLVKE